MATFNVGIRISNAVSATASTSGSSTLYTCPANSYAILNVYLKAENIPTEGVITVGGQAVLFFDAVGASFQSSSQSASTGSGSSTLYANFAVTAQSIYVGPGQTVVVTRTSGGQITGKISGVEFTNTL